MEPKKTVFDFAVAAQARLERFLERYPKASDQFTEDEWWDKFDDWDITRLKEKPDERHQAR